MLHPHAAGRSAFAAGAWMVIVGLTLPARAADPEPGPAWRQQGDSPTRQQLYEQALSHLKAGRHVQSHDILAELWKQQRSFDVAMAMGGVELLLRKYPEAAFHFHYAKEHLPPSFTEAHAKKIDGGLELAWHHVGLLEMNVTPEDASIRVDGQAAEQPLYLMPGDYDITVSSAGYADETRRVSITASQRTRLDLRLKPLGPEPAARQERPSPVAEESDETPRWPVLLLGGAATATLGGFALHSFSEASAEQRKLEACATDRCGAGAGHADRRDEHHLEGLTYAGAALGAGVVTAMVWYLWPEQQEAPLEARVSPAGGSLMLRRHF